ncbi:MAG: ABC transporter permease [Tunicatimonas sp.]
MLNNYLTTTLRHFRQHYRYATLNIIGLAIGFAACILIAGYVHYETSYENFHSNADRIYRATYRFQSEGEFGVHWARVPVDYVNELPHELPEVETLVRFQNHEQKYLRVGREKFRPKHAYVTDPEVFRVFDFPFLLGDPATALERPRSLVLTQTAAQRYFGSDDVLGRELYVASDFTEEELTYTVTGVMADVPSSTHLPVEILLSYRDADERTGWAYVYTLLREGANVVSIEDKLPTFIDKYTSTQDGQGVSFVFQPLSSIHLDSDLAREIVPNGSRLYGRVFAAVGAFILLIALLNYVNLSSALAMGRTREVGVRTVLGASQWQLMTHAGVEAITYNLVAMAGGGLLAYAAFPYFHALTGVELLVSPVAFAGVLLLVAVGCGLLAGGYPAWMLASVRTLEAIKSNAAFTLARRTGEFGVKRAMVMIQFAVSMLLIASALVAYDQFRFLHQKNLGLTTEQVLALPNLPNAVAERYDAFRERVATLAGVQQVAACMEVPSREIRDSGPMLVKGVSDDP